MINIKHVGFFSIFNSNTKFVLCVIRREFRTDSLSVSESVLNSVHMGSLSHLMVKFNSLSGVLPYCQLLYYTFKRHFRWLLYFVKFISL